MSDGPGRLLVLSGPSGVGKDTVLERLVQLEPRLRRSVSFTTRIPRPGEVDGVAYTFVGERAFRRMLERGELLEHADVHGNLYGTSAARVREALARGEDVVLKIDVQGAAQVRERAPEALMIFLLPPDQDELLRRLHGRGTESTDELRVRVDNAVAELAQAEAYDHRVVNDDVDRAARAILALVEASRDENGATAGGHA